MVITTPEKEVMSEERSLKVRYESVLDRIAAAASRVGRRSEDIILVAVTKNASIDQIRELLSLGHVDLGENRALMLSQHAAQVDDFLQRHHEMRSVRPCPAPSEVRWHMIGHLQRNKVRKLIKLVRLIHSVDSLRLAEELQQVAAARLDEPIEVLIQVNVSGEREKHGVAPAAVRHLIEQVDTMFNLRVRGMMCMAPESDDPESARPVFERAHELFSDIRTDVRTGDRFNILSMGMSSDFEIAVECGANVVRVGSEIFG